MFVRFLLRCRSHMGHIEFRGGQKKVPPGRADSFLSSWPARSHDPVPPQGHRREIEYASSDTACSRPKARVPNECSRSKSVQEHTLVGNPCRSQMGHTQFRGGQKKVPRADGMDGTGRSESLVEVCPRAFWDENPQNRRNPVLRGLSLVLCRSRAIMDHHSSHKLR